MKLWMPLAAATFALGLTATFAPIAFAADDIGKSKVDPVTQKTVTVAKETPMLVVGGNKLYFVDAKNRETFLKNPESFLKTPQVCPVKGSPGRANKANRAVVNDQIVYFCCTNCAMEFSKDPGILGKVKDPVTGNEFSLAAGLASASFKGSTYYFENDTNKAAFEKEPAKYAKVILQ